MPTREGFGKGRIDPDYSGVNEGIPLLNSFYFRFEREGSSEAVDNHINSIRVIPAGTPEDLSPNADLPLEIIDSGKISLMYRDKDPRAATDRYFYKVSHFTERFSITFPTATRRYQIRDISPGGNYTRALPRPPSDRAGLFVLVGFYLFFTGGRDQHFWRIGVFEEDGLLNIWFNYPSPVGYIIDYALWKLNPQQASVIRLGESTGMARGGARVTLPRGQKVIRGFYLHSPAGPNHLRDIGVLAGQESLEVYFADRSGEDPINWGVQWAVLQPLGGPATPANGPSSSQSADGGFYRAAREFQFPPKRTFLRRTR